MNRATQLARGAAAAAVAVFLAAFSHGVAAGEAPGWVGLVLSGLVALGVSVALLGRRGGPLRTVLAVGASQAVFHLLFSLGTGDPSVLEVSGSGHHQHVSVAASAMTASHGHGDTAMLLGHVAAGIATVLYLLAVEAAAWRALSRAVRGFVRSVTRIDAPAPVPVARAAAARPAVERARLRGRALLAQLRHRGPPAAPAFA
ncbi:hypothetical protein ACWKWP_12540 [Agromyces soli]